MCVSNFVVYTTFKANPIESSDQVIKIPVIDRVRNRVFSHLPPRIPSELASRLTHHGTPLAWWQGQLLTYLLRFSDTFQKKINENEKHLNFNHHQ